jgi:hypothetical protein
MAPLRRHRTTPRVIRPEQAHAEGMRFIHRIDLAGHGPRCPRGGAARRARDAQAELAHRRVVAGFPRWRRVVHLGRVPGPARPAGQRAVGLRLGRRLRPIPPYEALQRKPERDHDQAEDDDRQHREGQAHHRPRSDQAGCWPGQGTRVPLDRMVGCRRPASPLAALGLARGSHSRSRLFRSDQGVAASVEPSDLISGRARGLQAGRDPAGPGGLRWRIARRNWSAR